MAGGAEVAVVEETAVGAPTATATPPDVAAHAAAGGGEEAMRMEGWLYLIRSNRFGMQYSRKRYFVLEDAALRCFKSAPSSKREVTHASRFLFCVGGGDPLRVSSHFLGGILGVRPLRERERERSRSIGSDAFC
jgi:hypothetical protein